MLDIVPDAAANFEQGLLGESTWLAQALIGQRTGGVVDYGVAICARCACWR